MSQLRPGIFGAPPRDPTWVLDRSLSILKLSPKAEATLNELGFKTMRDILLLTAGELERIPEIGVSTVSQIDEFLTTADLMYASEAGHVLRPGVTVLWDLAKREFSFFLTHPDPLVGVGYGPLILNPKDPIYRLRSLPSFTFREAFDFLQQTTSHYCDVRHNARFIRSIFAEYAFDLVPPTYQSVRYETQVDSTITDPA